MTFAVKRSRSTHEFLCSRIITNDNPQLRRIAHSNMPENILPYLLHLLSYHPDFPTSTTIETEGDKKKLKSITRSLKMLLTILTDTLRNDANNISFLLKQLNLISQYHVDKWDNENIGLQFVNRVALSLINENIKTSDNVAEYPGEIHLPSELYLFRDSKNKNDNVDVSFEKAVQFASKGSKFKQILSPSSNQKRSNKPFQSDEKEQIKNNKRNISESSEHLHSDQKDNPKKIVRKSINESELLDAPSRTLPSRKSKEIVVSYKDPDVNEKEIKLWDERVEETHKRKSIASGDKDHDKRTDKIRSSSIFASSNNNIINSTSKVNRPVEIQPFDLFNSQTSDALGDWNQMVGETDARSPIVKNQSNISATSDDGSPIIERKNKNNTKKGRVLSKKVSENVIQSDNDEVTSKEKTNKKMQQTVTRDLNTNNDKKVQKKSDNKKLEKVIVSVESTGNRRSKPIRG